MAIRDDVAVDLEDPDHAGEQAANAASLLRVSAKETFSTEDTMTVARITEISSISSTSFEDAIVQAIERANKTLKNLKGAWVKDQEVTIDNGKITGYKVILKVTFVLTD